jgi:hypothetical protein
MGAIMADCPLLLTKKSDPPVPSILVEEIAVNPMNATTAIRPGNGALQEES